MFEQASRLSIRFDSPSIGRVTTEDLWNLSLTELDEIAKDLNKEVKESEEESFIIKTTQVNKAVTLKFDLVKHVIKVLLDESEKIVNEINRKAKKEKILSIMARKEDEEMQGKTHEELSEMLDDI